MIITKESMKQETYLLLEVLFSLPEIEKVQIRDTFISSLQDEEAICIGLEESYHDRYSDVDINVYIRVHPVEHDDNVPIYFDSIERIGLKKEDILGIHPVPKKEAVVKEGLRILKTNGMRLDLTCYVTTDELVIPFNWEKKPFSEQEIKDLNFWFVAIHAIGKLKRKDYLIASHLTHIMVMEGLVQQMQIRDRQYNSTFHRYGFAEKLEYQKALQEDTYPFLKGSDETYDYIAHLLYSSIITYDKLANLLDAAYQPKADKFIAVWTCLNE